MSKQNENNTKGPKTQAVNMDKIVSLCKRRAFIFPSSEIYGGLAATWDYGPLGVELKKNIQNLWWHEMTRMHDNILGLDAAIMMHPKTWEASGHVENFSDPLVDCKKCKTRYRADILSPASIASKECPNCKGELTEARQFNLMFQTQLGSLAETGNQIYLRPETAQGIFVNFKNVLDTCRVQIPFGLAQVGKAFRNEITTRNFIFRTCEFEQMEMQYFIKPGTEREAFKYWKNKRLKWYTEKLGICKDRLRFADHDENSLAHYAKEATDIEYMYPHGWEETEGIHSRTDFDLSQHAEFSGKNLNYLDPQTNERYIPYVIETSAGLSRAVLICLLDAYEEQELGANDRRTVLHFHPDIAPFNLAILPLTKKAGLPDLAQNIYQDLRSQFAVFYDQQGSIGKRYRRQDEIGTPFCLTVDYDSIEAKTVTLRFRDSMDQQTIALSNIASVVAKAIKDYKV